MEEFRIQSLEQLPDILRAFRKRAGLTQAEAAKRLGVSQQVFSDLERHPERVAMTRLFKLLQLLDVALVLGDKRGNAQPNRTRMPGGVEW